MEEAWLAEEVAAREMAEAEAVSPRWQKQLEMEHAQALVDELEVKLGAAQATGIGVAEAEQALAAARKVLDKEKGEAVLAMEAAEKEKQEAMEAAKEAAEERAQADVAELTAAREQAEAEASAAASEREKAEAEAAAANHGREKAEADAAEAKASNERAEAETAALLRQSQSQLAEIELLKKRLAAEEDQSRSVKAAAKAKEAEAALQSHQQQQLQGPDRQRQMELEAIAVQIEQRLRRDMDLVGGRPTLSDSPRTPNTRGRRPGSASKRAGPADALHRTRYHSPAQVTCRLRPQSARPRPAAAAQASDPSERSERRPASAQPTRQRQQTHGAHPGSAAQDKNQERRQQPVLATSDQYFYSATATRQQQKHHNRRAKPTHSGLPPGDKVVQLAVRRAARRCRSTSSKPWPVSSPARLTAGSPMQYDLRVHDNDRADQSDEQMYSRLSAGIAAPRAQSFVITPTANTLRQQLRKVEALRELAEERLDTEARTPHRPCTFMLCARAWRGTNLHA